ncbi:MAG TPA: class I SAM-dependent methyltransferase, partial [Anaerolineales bacterium]|nr:class I SAM-dependent methyltransferase [Anaerolineales bacterium]
MKAQRLPQYDPASVVQHFDEFGVREWERLVQTPSDEVSLHVHTYYLEKYISRGSRVLEIGAGAGRFTQVLAGLGAQILVADISGVQLELNKRFALELGFDKAVIDRQQVDICDLSRFGAGSFDCVVAYGGPFSYVLDKRDLALSECRRVLHPGGMVLLSVMSLWGTAHGRLDGVLTIPISANQKITSTGDISPATFPERQGNFMHLFRAEELVKWLEREKLSVVALSASNCISLTWNEMLKQVRNDAEKWKELLRMEIEACADGGCLNM